LEWQAGGLKEIALPILRPSDKRKLDTFLDAQKLPKPVAGLYQLSLLSGLCVRPFPFAKEGRRLLSPTLVFILIQKMASIHRLTVIIRMFGKLDLLYGVLLATYHT
jgi:hypothetical protein